MAKDDKGKAPESKPDGGGKPETNGKAPEGGTVQQLQVGKLPGAETRAGDDGDKGKAPELPVAEQPNPLATLQWHQTTEPDAAKGERAFRVSVPGGPKHRIVSTSPEAAWGAYKQLCGILRTKATPKVEEAD